MPYQVQTPAGIVTADTVDEMLALIRELGGRAPAPAPSRPAPPPTRARPAPLDIDLDEPTEEPAFAPMYPSWDLEPPTVGEGKPAPRPLPQALTGDITVLSPTEGRAARSRTADSGAPAGTEAPSPAKPARQRCKICGGLGHNARRSHDADGRPAPDPPPQAPKGSDEYKRVISEGMKRSWQEKRARLGLPPKAAAARMGTPAFSQAISAAMKAVWERRRAAKAAEQPAAAALAQLPPRCVRCFRVGHAESECPKAARPPAPDAFTAGAAQAASNDPAKQEEGEDLTDWSGLFDETPLAASEADWTAPLAPGPQPETGPVLVTPPPPIDLPPAALHLPVLIDDSGPLLPPEAYDRPQTRGDCNSMPRPCPWVTCQHHLYGVAVLQAQARSGHAEKEPWQLPETSVLDVADRGATLEEIGQVLGITRERVRQIESHGLDRARRISQRRRWDFEDVVERQSGAPEDVAPFHTATSRGTK